MEARERLKETGETIPNQVKNATVDDFITIPCPCGEKHIMDGLYEIELITKILNP